MTLFSTLEEKFSLHVDEGSKASLERGTLVQKYWTLLFDSTLASFSRDGDTFVWKFDNFIDAALVSVLEMKAENGSIASEGVESQVIANIVKVSLA